MPNDKKGAWEKKMKEEGRGAFQMQSVDLGWAGGGPTASAEPDNARVKVKEIFAEMKKTKLKTMFGSKAVK